MDERNRQSHLEDDILANLKCEVLDEQQDGDDDDDVVAKSSRFRWRWLIGKQYRREEKRKQGYVIVDEHLFEDRKMVYVWMVCQGEREEEVFRCKTRKKRS